MADNPYQKAFEAIRDMSNAVNAATTLLSRQNRLLEMQSRIQRMLAKQESAQ